MTDFMKRRAGQLKYGGIMPGSPLATTAPDAVFGVDDGPTPYSVSLRLGPVQSLDLNREEAIAMSLLVLKRAVGNATAPRSMRDGMISMALLMLRSAGVEIDNDSKEQVDGQGVGNVGPDAGGARE